MAVVDLHMLGWEANHMPRKKPLVENARSGLDALKTQLFQQLQPTTPSYRDRFRQLAREHVAREPESDPKSPPNH